MASLLDSIGLITLSQLVVASSAATDTSSSMGQTSSGWGILAAGIIWMIVAIISLSTGQNEEVLRATLDNNTLEYAELRNGCIDLTWGWS